LEFIKKYNIGLDDIVKIWLLLRQREDEKGTSRFSLENIIFKE